MAERDLDGLGETLVAGDSSSLLGWLRERVHRHGPRYPPAKPLAYDMGSSLSATPILANMVAFASGVYGMGESAP